MKKRFWVKYLIIRSRDLFAFDCVFHRYSKTTDPFNRLLLTLRIDYFESEYPSKELVVEPENSACNSDEVINYLNNASRIMSNDYGKRLRDLVSFKKIFAAHILSPSRLVLGTFEKDFSDYVAQDLKRSLVNEILGSIGFEGDKISGEILNGYLLFSLDISEKKLYLVSKDREKRLKIYEKLIDLDVLQRSLRLL